jgi:hypothetical protein
MRMKPEADQVLNTCAFQLLMNVAPLLPSGYPQGTASLIAMLSMMAAQEYERGADIRAAENNDMRRLFTDIAALVDDDSLKTRLRAAAETKDASLTISALDAANYELRRLLIAAHTHIEQRPGADARDAERRIWAVLKASADRRLVRVPVG